MTHWSPIVSNDASPSPKIVGFRCRVHEVEGVGGRVPLRCFRKPVAAERTDLAGKMLSNLVVDDDRALIDLGAYEWQQIDVRWEW